LTIAISSSLETKTLSPTDKSEMLLIFEVISLGVLVLTYKDLICLFNLFLMLFASRLSIVSSLSSLIALVASSLASSSNSLASFLALLIILLAFSSNI
jgi:hypothetical protein